MTLVKLPANSSSPEPISNFMDLARFDFDDTVEDNEVLALGKVRISPVRALRVLAASRCAAQFEVNGPSP